MAKCPFDVRGASWENTVSCMCHRQPGQQERSPEEELMEVEVDVVRVGGLLPYHVRGSGDI